MLDEQRKLTRARFALMRDHPFFATILLQLDLDPADRPADPVLWVATSDRKPPPFGEVVRLPPT